MIHELFGWLYIIVHLKVNTPHDCIYMEISPANSNVGCKIETCRAFVVAFEQGEMYSSCHTYCDMGLRFLWSHAKDCAIYSSLAQKAKGNGVLNIFY